MKLTEEERDLLWLARAALVDHRCPFICTALLGAEEYPDQSLKLRRRITSALEGHLSLTGWQSYHDVDHMYTERRADRIAWIDHMLNNSVNADQAGQYFPASLPE
jgi:hypothetical protein